VIQALNLTQPSAAAVEQAYVLAKERYAALGVDTDAALAKLKQVPISLHCWQGDDVGGFEDPGRGLSGGIMATGNYPGKARSAQELRQDLDLVYSLLPGRHRLNLHAIYLEADAPVARNDIEPKHFAGWLEWAKTNHHGIDFNPTFFSHPLADDGYTLAHPDAGVRQFWIDHGRACRQIGATFGQALGTPCVTNVWIPDGSKDTPAARKAPRERLIASLDALFEGDLDGNLDAVESKLFGLGSESYVVGSHEFYLAYAQSRGKVLCLDAGHFHPTETISDKLSAVLLFVERVLLHVSRGVRWDSDHVVTVSDDLLAIMRELVRGDFLPRVNIGLDFFDASINRLAAWVIGTRSALQGLLMALLEPHDLLLKLEADNDLSSRLALHEAQKTLPYGAVWDYYCLQEGVPVGVQFLEEIRRYEADVLALRQ
jgi:L-rhamnose isomerase